MRCSNMPFLFYICCILKIFFKSFFPWIYKSTCEKNLKNTCTKLRWELNLSGSLMFFLFKILTIIFFNVFHYQTSFNCFLLNEIWFSVSFFLVVFCHFFLCNEIYFRLSYFLVKHIQIGAISVMLYLFTTASSLVTQMTFVVT